MTLFPRLKARRVAQVEPVTNLGAPSLTPELIRVPHLRDAFLVDKVGYFTRLTRT
jgi:hypothetical protein